MALEEYVRETRELIESLRSKADALEKNLKERLRLQDDAGVLKDGLLIRKPDGWNVADDIKRILESGTKTMPRDELIGILVDKNLVKGTTRRIMIGAARRAITVGLVKGYLALEEGDLLRWIPGIYKNPRLGKKRIASMQH